MYVLREKNSHNRPIVERLIAGNPQLPLKKAILGIKDLIQPLFLLEGEGIVEPSETIPGAVRLTLDKLDAYLEQAIPLGLRSLLLFAIPSEHHAHARHSYAPANPIALAAQKIREQYPELILFADICVCHHTPEAHCGVMKDGVIDREQTIEILQKQALLFAKSGIDILMPSSMTPGIVGALRQTLDTEGFPEVAIANQTIKFASSFYGPIQKSTFYNGKQVSKKDYQVPYANTKEALSEIEADLNEGVDIITIKPALNYQDIIHEVRQMTTLPIIAFLTSGEHILLQNLAARSGKTLAQYTKQVLSDLRSAGADIVVSYATTLFAEKAQNKGLTEFPRDVIFRKR